MNLKNPYFLIGSSEVISKVLSWLTLALIPFFVSSELYGEIVLYYSLIVFLIPIYLFGQDRLIIKGLAEDEACKSLVLTMLIWLSLVLVLLYFGYFLVSIASLLLTLNKIYLTYYRSKDKLQNYALNRLVYSSVRLIAVLFIVYYFYSIKGYILAESISALIATIGIISIYKPKYIKNIDWFKRLKHGLPLALHGVSIFGVAVADRFILEKYTDLSTVGNYSFLYIFASGLIFLYSIISIIQEKIIYRSNDKNSLYKNIKRTLLLMILIGLIGSISSYILYNLIFYFDILKNYIYLPLELIILLIAHMILPVYLVLNYYLIQQDKANYLLFCSLLSLMVNIILNFILIPNFGLMGAIWATLISNTFLVCVISIICLKVSMRIPTGNE